MINSVSHNWYCLFLFYSPTLHPLSKESWCIVSDSLEQQLTLNAHQKGEMRTFILVFKFIFFLILFIIFVILFGKPAIDRYLDKSVIIETSMEPIRQLLDAPAITICVDSAKAWKNRTETKIGKSSNWTLEKSLNIECDNPKTAVDVVQCIYEHIYDFDEMIKQVLWHTSYIDTPWKSSITSLTNGKCHTLENYGQLGVNAELHSAQIILNPNLSYRVFLHDPLFFFITLNPLAVPQIATSIKISQENHIKIQIQYVSVTKHIKMKREGAHCEDDPHYSLTSCIRRSVVDYVGYCTLWDSGLYPDMSDCQTKQEMMKMATRFMRLTTWEQSEVFKVTGCSPPCTYIEYVDVGGNDWELKADNSSLVFGLSYATTQVRVEKEIFIYPFSSFLAEFGGALGMFLGFSFHMFWDVFNWFLVRYVFKKEQN